MAWLSKYNYQVMDVFEHRKSDAHADSDVHQLQCALKVSKVSGRHTPLGQLLNERYKDKHNYLKEMAKMKKLMHQSKPKDADDKCKSSTKLFETAAEMHQ